MKQVIIIIVLIIYVAIIFTGCSTGIGYIKRGQKIYYFKHAGPMPMFGLNWQRHETEMKDVDIETFIYFKKSPYAIAKDKNHVYYQGKIADEYDAATFEVLSYTYAKDKNHVYEITSSPGLGSVVKDADPETFIAIGKDMGKDANHSFQRWWKIDELPNEK
jgi:hypothetical protein